MINRLLAIALLLAAVAADAAKPNNGQNAPPKAPPAAEVPAPPPLPQDYQPEPPPPEPGAIEPEITITTRGTEIREEYRVQGRLYMIKVTPAKGPSYYLIDYEGSGVFRRSDLEPAISPPMWVIKRF